MNSDVYFEDVSDNYSIEDLVLFANSIGIDEKIDTHLMFIAEEGIIKSLPYFYVIMKDCYGIPYFYNVITERSTWTHPIIEKYQILVKYMKSKLFDFNVPDYTLLFRDDRNCIDQFDYRTNIESNNLAIENLISDIKNLNSIEVKLS